MMMKLVLSFGLCWTLISTAAALKCWFGDNTYQPCNERCGLIVAQTYIQGKHVQNITQACLPTSVCRQRTGSSLNIGFLSWVESIQCCDTDGCNTNTLAPQDNRVSEKDNNLQCFTCPDSKNPDCKQTLQCLGGQDRCFRGAVSSEGVVIPAFGCISSVLCGDDKPWFNKPFGVIQALIGPNCCGTSFCNSATPPTCGTSTVRLAVIALLCMHFVAC
ncbi:hypothetical protein JOB18_036474 [Solea senegalensis]|uniref:UPAR/Ly6 domain-containing protein n=1 Tax=Solea senegalensis TaxID=28829 RepID=A0AAV6SCE9_SOLSE|nr:uncharacterized protein LOC122781009 [Solea senegalensis]KAG7514530.1 hypothetical protein JOB18_036474 [Solea senegalensis]